MDGQATARAARRGTPGMGDEPGESQRWDAGRQGRNCSAAALHIRCHPPEGCLAQHVTDGA
eukprot:2725798-Rhodomonas_salina.1